MSLETVIVWVEKYPFFVQLIKVGGVAALSFIFYFIAKLFVLKWLTMLAGKTKTKLDDILMQDTVIRRLSYIVPLIIIFSFAHVVPFAEAIIQKASFALISVFVLLNIGAILTGFNDIYLTPEMSKGRPLKGYVQILKLLIYIAGGIIILSFLLERSPLILLSGFGAMTAVLLLVFRDTILSFIASLQITTNDLVRVGDWIEIPKYGADGDVIDIALHTVTIQNWDKTLTVVPTHKVIEETFKNWRGMKLSGGRRIKRSVYIDMTSIRFCDEKMIEKFSRYQLISDYMKHKREDIEQHNKRLGIDTSNRVNGRRLTNVGTFRAYIEAYLRNQKNIHKEMTFLVRQMPPGADGLPIEIYVFSNDTVWANYEAIQADIFDHILAVLPEFDLRIFQNPTGRDFGKLLVNGT
ncbi:MAG: mechanosensitive ion channel family protein [Proteobacteria bacterium]|nr:mechanosensitive ion channel family protein [Pseudomonadota bacterium]